MKQCSCPQAYGVVAVSSSPVMRCRLTRFFLADKELRMASLDAIHAYRDDKKASCQRYVEH